MECDQREAAELAASLATKRAGQAPLQRKRMTPSLHMQTTRIPTREFREPNPKSNNVQDKRHCPQTGKGEKKDRYREQRNTKHITI